MSPGEAPLLTVRGLSKSFAIRTGLFGREIGRVRAVRQVDLTCGRGETVGCVGESGCGKTTLGRAILRLVEPDEGTVRFQTRGAEVDVRSLAGGALRAVRREMQIVFQDPYSSLNPRMTVGGQIGEPLRVHGLRRGAALKERVAELLELVGLDAAAGGRFPHAFSGGQRQRIGIARALALEPSFIVCDEPVSALDVSVQAQILNLLQDLGRRLHIAYLFISHDLSVVRHVSDRVLVMYLGQVVEEADTAELFASPRHPYTRALLSSAPARRPGERRERSVLPGEPPSPSRPPPGCPFHPRCKQAEARCASEPPPVRAAGSGFYRCHLES